MLAGLAALMSYCLYCEDVSMLDSIYTVKMLEQLLSPKAKISAQSSIILCVTKVMHTHNLYRME